MYCKSLNALLFKHCIKWKEKKTTATDLHFVINSEEKRGKVVSKVP